MVLLNLRYHAGIYTVYCCKQNFSSHLFLKYYSSIAASDIKLSAFEIHNHVPPPCLFPTKCQALHSCSQFLLLVSSPAHYI